MEKTLRFYDTKYNGTVLLVEKTKSISGTNHTIYIFRFVKRHVMDITFDALDRDGALLEWKTLLDIIKDK